MSKIIGIAAMGRNREIGTKGKLCWPPRSYKDDMMHFKSSTKGQNNIGHPCIMTVPSWDSIDPKYRPFSGRLTIIVSSQSRQDLKLPSEVVLANSPGKAIHLAEKSIGSDEIFICGGRYLYEWAIENADELWITEIPEEFPDADAFFPEFLSKGWVEFERKYSPNMECTFVKYRKVR